MNPNFFPFSTLDNFDFDVFIGSSVFNSNCQFSNNKFDLKYLESKQFIQFENDVDSIESSLDPDVNFYNNSSNYSNECKYYFNDSFDINPKINQFSFLTLNINSIPKNLLSFETQFLNNLNYNFKILGFVETKLTDDIENLYHLNSYNQITNNNTRNSGGLALYCHSDLEVIVREDLNRKTVFMESLFVEVVSGGKNRIVGLIYHRPNSNKNDFVNMLENILNILSRENKLVYLTGDFNIDLLNKNTYLPSKNLINLFNSYNYVSLVNNPSRVTNSSTTIIDHIWTNDCENTVYNGLFYDFTSDHFPVFSIFNNESNNFSHIATNIETLTFRSFSEDNILKFKTELQEIDWSECLHGNDTNEVFDNFMICISNLFEQNFPKITKTKKIRKNNKPYITQEIKLLIKEKDRMQKKYAKYPITFGEQYKRLRNYVTNEIRKAKHKYYRNKLDLSFGNSKKTWKVINEIVKPNNEKKNKSIKFINPSNPEEVITDDKLICETFNNYYVNAGKNLSDNITDNNIPATHYLDSRCANSLIFKLTDRHEVTRLIEGLNDSAAGIDEIPSRIIKHVSNEIASPLTIIFNKSMSEGIFPDQLKKAKITPIFKKGNKNECKNYRPVSVLPCLSKILESLIHDRLSEFLINNHIISDAQHGFQKQKSTTSAILTLTDDILKSFDNKNFTIALFLDLSKAFETVNHNILLTKLEHYGIRNTSLKWFTSYLENRQQVVKFNLEISSTKEITLSVPQGSLLGPALFNIYINDLTSITKRLKTILYADDSCLYLAHNDISTAINLINNELKVIGNWFTSNKLTLNYDKSHFLVFSRRKNSQFNMEPIKINNISITQVNSTKFLGVILQDNLSWKTHIDQILCKLHKFSSILYLTRNSLNNQSLKLIYQSLVYPTLTYCCVIWGKAPNKYINSIFIAQKKIIRIIKFKNRCAHTNIDFLQLNILKFHDIIKYFALVFVYKSLNNISYPVNYFSIFDHTYNLRTLDNLRTPLIQTTQGQTSISFYGCNLWNELPSVIRNKPSLGSFKRSLKRHLVDQYS